MLRNFDAESKSRSISARRQEIRFNFKRQFAESRFAFAQDNFAVPHHTEL